MDKVKRRKLGTGLFFGTGFISGVLAGVLGLTMVVSHKIDTYHIEINSLKAHIADRDARLEKLQKSVNNRRFVLNEIEVILDYKGDNLDKIDIEKYIKQKYADYIGKEVKSIDAEMASDVIDRRVEMFKSGYCRLKVDRMVLSDVMKIWVTAENIK